MRYFALLVAVLLSCGTALAADFYADVEFDVQPDGAVVISGTTNHPQLSPRSTQEFTSKDRQRWLLNITLPEQFSDYIFTITLPEGAVLTYANGKNLNIGTQGNAVTIKSYGQDGLLSITAQYTLTSPQKEYFIQILASLISALVICGILLLAYHHGKRRQKAVAKSVEKAHKKISLIDGLPARQQEILALLDRANGALTQKQIEKELGLPKASVSRNIESLRRKGLIEKEQSGMSNVVRLAKV